MPQEIIPPPPWDRDEELAEVQREMAALSESIDLEEERERCEGSFLEFFKAAWPQIDVAPLKLNWHHDCIAEHLEAVRRGEIRNILFNVPPRCTKTSEITVAFPAWLWTQQEIDFLSGPQASFLCASYGEKPVLRQAQTARQLLMGPWYQQRWGRRVRIVKDGLDELRNSAGGYRLSASLGGAILGAGAGLRILDDPQSPEMAESETERERSLRLFTEGLSTRRTDPVLSALIVVMQRLQEGDISGHILSEMLEDFVHVMIPMRFDPRRYIPSAWYSDPRTEDGELLWPEQFPKGKVDEDERIMGPTATAGQYQQSPVARGGNIIQRDWWRLWPDDAPEFADQSTICSCPSCGWVGPREGTEPEVTCTRCAGRAERRVVFPEFSFRVLSVDTNFGDKEQNAYSAATVWSIWHAKDDMPRAMLCAGWRGRPPLRTDPQKPREMGLVERFHHMAARHQVDCILIEGRTRAWDLSNELAKETQEWHSRLELFNPAGRGDKVARLHACQALFTNDCVWAPNKSWADMVIQEVVTAPRGRYWDLSDTSAQALLYLRHDLQLLKLPDEYKREQIRERLIEASVKRSNVRELIEG
jgi:hypothetical protein